MTQLPAFECYTEHNGKNYGLNSLKFYTDKGCYWFSYKTLVAFKVVGKPLVVRGNEWEPTTGKHLNAIDNGDKKSRVSESEFNRLYREYHAD